MEETQVAMTMLLQSSLPWMGGVAVLLLVAGVLFYLWIRPWPIDPKLPGPIRHPWFGVGFSSNTEMAPGVHFEWSRWPTISAILSERWEYQTWGGPTLNIGFGGAFFNVISPENLEYILRTNHENYVKGKLAKSFAELMGQESAFSTDGSLWAFHRKMAVAVLNKQAVMEGSHFLVDKLRKVEAMWNAALEEERTIDVDFQNVASRITLDVVCLLGFGIDLHSVEEENDDGDNDDDSSSAATFVRALDEIQYLVHLRFVDFFWEIKQKLGIGKRERRIRQLKTTIDNFADRVIRSIQKEKDELKTGPQNIVRRYLRFSDEQEHPAPTAMQLRELILGFTMAGRDSTAAAMSWTLYELIQHPAVADRIRDEIQREIPRGGTLTMDHVKNLSYLHWTVMEALRLHPPAPESYRFAVTDDVLPDGTQIPAGSCVMYSTYTINRSRSVWKYPELFDPERYAGKEPSPFEWATFHAGPRSCPGRSLALMEVKVALAYLLPRFDFEDAVGNSGDYKWTIFMLMERFPVRVKKRWY